ncbi:hypothetical protein HID58_045340, partial [Brassica napus]
FGEDSCASKEDKIVVPLRKDPEVEKKKKPEHEHESEFGEEKESKERKEKALKEIEMGNAAYKATVLSKCDHRSGNKMDKVNEILSLACIDILASHLMYQKLDVPIPF